MIREIQGAIEQLARKSRQLEDLYIENEGEVTPDAEALEEEIAVLRDLLTSDGADDLGRWLKSKEDEEAALAAEAEYISRKQKSVQNTIAHIKWMIRRVMDATGAASLKGALGYSFTAFEKVSTSINKTALNNLYLDKVIAAAKAAGIPDYISIKLDASSSKVPEGTPLPDFFTRTYCSTVTFRKPKSKKHDNL